MKYIFTIILSLSLMNMQAQSTACYVPTRLQTQSNWCWAACVEMISDGYGNNISQCRAVQDAKNKIGDCLSGGTSLAACSYPSSNNYTNWVIGCRGSCSDLLTNNYGVRSSSFVKNGFISDFRNDVWGWLVGDRPFIAGGWFGGGGLNNGHAIVIEYYSKTTNKMGYDDPAFGYTSATVDWIYSKILVAAVPDNAKPGGRSGVSEEPVIAIADANNDNISLVASPNPARSSTTLQLNGVKLSDYSRVSVKNEAGVVVQDRAINANERTEQLDVSRLPRGLYIVSVSNQKETRSVKLIVQ